METDFNSLTGDLDSGPLSAGELRRLRSLLRDEDRIDWLRRKLKIILPWVFAAISSGIAIYQALFHRSS